ncbi:MAG: hypothetical protein JRJ62_01520 [Deltaproteobacteria bacterium]|nr:hypothetical protein [Deltaproteobacteria bacterium]
MIYDDHEFDEKSFNRYDEKANNLILRMINNSSLNLTAKRNRDKFGIDVLVYDSNRKCVVLVDGGVKKFWWYRKPFKEEFFHVEIRKRNKVMKSKIPILLVYFNTSFSHYIVVGKENLIGLRPEPCKNGQSFYNVKTKKCHDNLVEAISDTLRYEPQQDLMSFFHSHNTVSYQTGGVC